jgi:hypothetical protein
LGVGVGPGVVEVDDHPLHGAGAVAVPCGGDVDAGDACSRGLRGRWGGDGGEFRRGKAESREGQGEGEGEGEGEGRRHGEARRQAQGGAERRGDVEEDGGWLGAGSWGGAGRGRP